MKNIYLCGFMGSGKSAIGRLISKRQGLKHIDSDREIEKLKDMKIPEIFKKYGENYFRKLETDFLKSLKDSENLVISTGGGMMINKENAKIAKSNGIIVLLEIPFDLCWERIKNSNRPLVVNNKKDKIKTIYDERQKMYRLNANIAVSNDKSSSLCANKIISLIKFREKIGN